MFWGQKSVAVFVILKISCTSTFRDGALWSRSIVLSFICEVSFFQPPTCTQARRTNLTMSWQSLKSEYPKAFHFRATARSYVQLQARKSARLT
ncbi:hypothetical protein BFW88_16960 [Pseudomonas fluorescens]|nr:hypothetical protein BFW88_16960 [Pseudomonas fluorescens]OPB07764.1 hypothetical protein BFW92_16885 [Pseudomonas fluorescens]OPB19036.1 hypothetical protein BFW93_16915 [Pseudomonas fluorescens]